MQRETSVKDCVEKEKLQVTLEDIWIVRAVCKEESAEVSSKPFLEASIP